MCVCVLLTYVLEKRGVWPVSDVTLSLKVLPPTALNSKRFGNKLTNSINKFPFTPSDHFSVHF